MLYYQEPHVNKREMAAQRLREIARVITRPSLCQMNGDRITSDLGGYFIAE